MKKVSSMTDMNSYIRVTNTNESIASEMKWNCSLIIRIETTIHQTFQRHENQNKQKTEEFP